MDIKKYPLSLRSRLTLAASLWLGLILLLTAFFIPSVIEGYLIKDTQDQLKHSFDELSANLELDLNKKLTIKENLSDPRFNRPYSGLYWSVYFKNEHLESRSLWDSKITLDGKQGTATGARGEPLIYLENTVYFPGSNKPAKILIGIDKQNIDDMLLNITQRLWMILGLIFISILMLVSLQISWSLHPFKKLQRELLLLRQGDINELTQHYPQEVAPLIRDLNSLLFHYQDLLKRARQHSGNLAHALKTPLNILKNDIAHLPVDAQRQLLPEIEKINNSIQYHLNRARIAGTTNILGVKSNPSDRVDAISMAFDKVYASREVILINQIDPDLNVRVEQSDLDEMLGNIIENAYKWTASTITVSGHIIDKKVEIIIEDNGEGISADKIKEVMLRGVRLDEKTAGTGLGLDIVKELALSYQGDFMLSSDSGGGVKAILLLDLL